MLNLLRVDLRRYWMSPSAILPALAYVIIGPVLMALLELSLLPEEQSRYTVTIQSFSAFPSAALFVLAMLVLVLLREEVGEGIVRNKVISGQKRHLIFLSYCVSNALLAILLQLLSLLSTFLVPLMVGAVYALRWEELVRLFFVSALAELSISFFYTALCFCFCNSKAGAVMVGSVPILAFVLLKITSDGLYTQSGIPKVSGPALRLYTAFDRYCPFAHLNGALRWDDRSYLLGSAGLIFLSLAVGLSVFSRKKLN